MQQKLVTMADPGLFTGGGAPYSGAVGMHYYINIKYWDYLKKILKNDLQEV